ncbi:MAG TPA: ABC transporter ATP-binding protein [Planctomycetaceae bacterium]|nr:ABC transporter ATP-binding protein [Planctomycetaceae bacterium]
MKTITVRNHCSDFDSYRAARVKSLFNAESGCNFNLDVNLDLSGDWGIGVVVGPSGSGKTSIGKRIFGRATKIHDYRNGWPVNKPIIDAISPTGSFNEVTGALASVGLGDVPAWLRPFRVLSNGEQFRAGLARLICEKLAKVVIDEFTSVIDRRIAQIGSQAFQKAWRRSNPRGKAVLLTPHYDILDWVQPDWVLDLRTGKFARGRLWRRPTIDVDIFKVDQGYWRYFKSHYYLDLPMPPAAEYFVGTANGELSFHLAVAPLFTAGAYRATRLVVMPEWQGAGVGVRLLEWVCRYHLDGNGWCNRKLPTFFHTSHPQLCAALRRRSCWVNTRRSLYGDNKARSIAAMIKSGTKVKRGFGGHFRAISAFKYVGEIGQ